MDTEESESEEDGKVERERREGEILEDENVVGSVNEEKTREDVKGNEGSTEGEDKEVESEGEKVEEQDVEDNAYSEEKSREEEVGRIDEAEKVNESLEGKLGEVSEVSVDGRENPDGEKESVPEEEEEVEKPTEEEDIETEIVLLDDVETEDQEGPRDERFARRHSRRTRKHEDKAVASRPKSLRLEDIEETGDDIPQVQETLEVERDISPEALETRYKAERKRKGKHAAKP